MPLIASQLIVGIQEPVVLKAAELPVPPIAKQITKEELSPRLSFGNFINLSVNPAEKTEPTTIPEIFKKVVVENAPAQPISKQITKRELSLNPRLSFGNFINLSAKLAEEPKPTISKILKKVVVENAPAPAPAPVSKYIKKHDGELIRHINTRSQYLKDIFEDFKI